MLVAKLNATPDSVRILRQQGVLSPVPGGLASEPVAIAPYFGSFVLRLPNVVWNTEGVSVIVFADAHSKQDTISMLRDEHVDLGETGQSVIQFLDSSIRHLQVRLISANCTSVVSWELVMVHVPLLEVKEVKPIMQRGSCSEPVLIPQSVWRAGLPPPVPGRTSTPTQHCIVHHSADGNGNTNYTDLVRTYYTYHTQVNGWDDIAYNYLIAANGAVYAGRDPEKAGIRQDNVLGAHFCGKNNLTMGICIIGNYVSTEPSVAAIASLKSLLGWKMALDHLNPNGAFRHPDAAGALLPVIAGHRDGCSTECPGDRLYAKLQELRQEAESCTTALKDLYTYSQEGKLCVANTPSGSSIRIYDLKGALLAAVSETGTGTLVFDIEPGQLLLLRIATAGGRAEGRLLYHHH